MKIYMFLIYYYFLCVFLFNPPHLFAVPMKEKSAVNVIHVYLSGNLAHTGRGVAITSDNGT